MAFNGRRGVNVSQYVANLNNINPPINSTSPESYDDPFNQDDLNLFATAQFFDFDMGAGEEEELQKKKKQKQEQQAKADENLSFMDSLNNFDFDYASILGNLSEVAYTPQLSIGNANTAAPPPPQSQHAYIQPQPILPAASSTSTSASPIDSSHKRKASVLDATPYSLESPDSLDDVSRVAADEDKRRRNTAASARFRIKKKQREQAMESHARELEEKCKKLEGRVNHLEMENKWLRSLITDKKEVVTKKDEVDVSSTSIASTTVDSSSSAGKKGVGTTL